VLCGSSGARTRISSPCGTWDLRVMSSNPVGNRFDPKTWWFSYPDGLRLKEVWTYKVQALYKEFYHWWWQLNVIWVHLPNCDSKSSQNVCRCRFWDQICLWRDCLSHFLEFTCQFGKKQHQYHLRKTVRCFFRVKIFAKSYEQTSKWFILARNLAK
jgi:hypothetical protein